MSRSASQTTSAVSSVQPPRNTPRLANSALLVLVEQVVRPGDRRPQRRVALLGVAGSLQRVEPVGEAIEQRLGREQLRPGGGELERQRQAVEPVAELHDGVRRGDVGPHRLRAFAEQRHRLVAHERREVELGLALDPQRLAARGEQSQAGTAATSSASGRATPGRRCSRLSHTTCVRRSPMRAAIAAGSGADAPSRSATAGSTNSASRSGASGTKTVPPAASSPSRRASSIAEPRLAGSARADDREHARIAFVDQRDGVEQFLLAAEKRRGRHRELDAPRRSERRELAIVELVEANRAVEVLEPVLAEVAEGLRVEERRGASARRGSGCRARAQRSALRGGRPARRTPLPSAWARRCAVPCAREPYRLRARLARPARPRRLLRRSGTRGRTRRPAYRPRLRPARPPPRGRSADARASASAYPAGPSSCSSRVEPSMSVKRNVTVPSGSAPMARMMDLDCGRRTSACAGSRRTRPSRRRDPRTGRRRSPSAKGRRGSSPPPSRRVRCRTRGSSCPRPRSAGSAPRRGAAR